MKRPIVIILLALAFLFVLVGIGTAILFATGEFSLNRSPVVLNQGLVHATTEESKTLEVDGPVTLNVRNDAGAVTVTGGDADEVTVKVVKTGAARTQARAELNLENIKYEIVQEANAINLTYRLSDRSTQELDTVDFIVTIPSEATIDVDAGFGEVSVSQINGDVSIINDFGEVTAQNIEGGLNVDTQSGRVEASSVDAGSKDIELSSGFGAILLESASGKDVTLRSRSGSLEAADVQATGNIEVSTDFGDISFTSGSANRLSIETNSGKVTLDTVNLRGELIARSGFGEINLQQVETSSYDLQTNSGSITVDGAQDMVKAHSGFGSITVRNGESVTLDLSTRSGSVDFEGSLGQGPHSVHSEFGEISLTIPADSALDVDLKTNFGSIKSDIPITVTLTGEVDKGRQTGSMNDGGDQLTVETGSGSISIQASR